MNRLNGNVDLSRESGDRGLAFSEILPEVHGDIFTIPVNLRQDPISPDWRWNASPPWRKWPMANKIRAIREELGFTQGQVADAAGTTIQQLSRLERGDRRLTDEWMRRIAKALGVPAQALLSDEPPNQGQIIEQPKKIRLRPDEIGLIRFWRTLDIEGKLMIAGYARSKGLEILADNPKNRAA